MQKLIRSDYDFRRNMEGELRTKMLIEKAIALSIRRNKQSMPKVTDTTEKTNMKLIFTILQKYKQLCI